VSAPGRPEFCARFSDFTQAFWLQFPNLVGQLAAIQRPDLVAESNRVLVLSSLPRGNPIGVRDSGPPYLRGQRNHDNRAQWPEIIRLENHGRPAPSLLVVTLRLAKIDQPHFAALGDVHG
jgi:hypothetical protein